MLSPVESHNINMNITTDIISIYVTLNEEGEEISHRYLFDVCISIKLFLRKLDRNTHVNYHHHFCNRSHALVPYL